MRLCILVLSCNKAKYSNNRQVQWNNSLNETSKLGIPIFYIFGKSDTKPVIPVSNNTYLIISNSGDDYEDIPDKMFYAYNILRNLFDVIIKIDDNILINDMEETLKVVKSELICNSYVQLIGVNNFPKSSIVNSHMISSEKLRNVLALIPSCHYAGGSAYALRFDAMQTFEHRDFKVTIFEDVNVGYKLNKYGIIPFKSSIVGTKFLDIEPPFDIHSMAAWFPEGDDMLKRNYDLLPTKLCSVLVRGGLGNQLFMICTALAHAIRTNSRLRLIWEKSEWRPHYFESVLSGFARYVEDTMPAENSIIYTEDVDTKFGYVRLPYTEPGIHLNLIGYFQSSKYFPELKDIIHLLPRFPECQVVDSIMNECPGTPVIIHVRRTDYFKVPDYHYVQPLSYYENAISIIREKISNPYFLLISDDVPFLSAIPVKPEESKTVDLDDIRTMKLMSKCQHFVIANSTYSWWGALFGRAHLVIAPKTWFGPKGPQDWYDIYEDGWIVI